MARRRGDPHARHARHPRRRRAPSGSPIPSRASRPTSGPERSAQRLDFLAAPLEEVRESFARLGCDRGVRFVPGFFEDDAAPPRRRAAGRSSGSTPTLTSPPALALARLYPGLAVGGYLVVDDYCSFQGCRQAVDEFRAEHGITEPLEQVDSTGVRWRRESDRAVQAPLPDAAAARRAPPTTRARDTHIPTERGLELERELASWSGAPRPRSGSGHGCGVSSRRDSMIVFATSITDPELYERVRGARHPPRRRARLRGDRQRRRRARSSAPTT